MFLALCSLWYSDSTIGPTIIIYTVILLEEENNLIRGTEMEKTILFFLFYHSDGLSSIDLAH